MEALSDIHVFEVLLPLALILALSKVLMKLCERIGIPTVVGMLLSGVLIGLIQYIPGQTVLSDGILTGLSFFAKIGVILIMFSAGLETDLGKIKEIGKPAFIITAFGVIVPMALGFIVATLCNGGFERLSENLIQNLFYGCILTATSVSVSVATLKELGRLNTKIGATIITAAILDDIIGVVVLSFILALGAGDSTNPWIVLLKTLLYFAAVIIFAFIARRAFSALDKKFPHHRLIPILSLALCFLVAYASEKLFGIADITGAYFVGLILSTNPDTKYIDEKSDVLSYMFFVPVFFANIGISTKFTGITPAVVLFGFLFIIAGMLGKLLGCGGAALASGYTPSDSVKIGFGMMARAEVALVCAQKGIDAGLIDSSIMPFILILILVTSFVTPIGILKSYKHDYMKFSHDLCDE